MFRDPLIQHAWEMRRQAEHFPLEVLLDAAGWLEEKYRKAPSQELAVALALQYFILAMRRASASPPRVKAYFSQAIRWRDEAAHAFPCPHRLLATPNLN